MNENLILRTTNPLEDIYRHQCFGYEVLSFQNTEKETERHTSSSSKYNSRLSSVSTTTNVTVKKITITDIVFKRDNDINNKEQLDELYTAYKVKEKELSLVAYKDPSIEKSIKILLTFGFILIPILIGLILLILASKKEKAYANLKTSIESKKRNEINQAINDILLKAKKISGFNGREPNTVISITTNNDEQLQCVHKEKNQTQSCNGDSTNSTPVLKKLQLAVSITLIICFIALLFSAPCPVFELYFNPVRDGNVLFTLAAPLLLSAIIISFFKKKKNKGLYIGLIILLCLQFCLVLIGTYLVGCTPFTIFTLDYVSIFWYITIFYYLLSVFSIIESIFLFKVYKKNC